MRESHPCPPCRLQNRPAGQSISERNFHLGTLHRQSHRSSIPFPWPARNRLIVSRGRKWPLPSVLGDTSRRRHSQIKASTKSLSQPRGPRCWYEIRDMEGSGRLMIRMGMTPSSMQGDGGRKRRRRAWASAVLSCEGSIQPRSRASVSHGCGKREHVVS